MGICLAITSYMRGLSHFKTTYILAIISCLILGCSKEKSSGSIVTTSYIHGDPMELIAGSTPNKVPFFTVDNYSSFNSARLKSIYYFIQSVPDQELQENGGGGGGPIASEFPSFTFSSGGGYYEYGSSSVGVRLRFYVSGINLYIQSVFLLDDSGVWRQYAATGEHYSRSADGKRFSILLSTRLDVYQKALIGLTFDLSSVSINLFNTDNSFYDYLFGVGVLAGWSQTQTHKISICGNNALNRRSEIQSAVSAWQNSLGQRLSLTTDAPTQFPPFSDVNVNCVYIADDYLFQTKGHSTVLGIAGPTLGGENIASGPIILFQGNLAESAPKLRLTIADLTYLVTLHELGHLLGLAHHEDSKSIMYPSLSQIVGSNILSLQSYDVNAIRNLYDPK